MSRVPSNGRARSRYSAPPPVTIVSLRPPHRRSPPSPRRPTSRRTPASWRVSPAGSHSRSRILDSARRSKPGSMPRLTLKGKSISSAFSRKEPSGDQDRGRENGESERTHRIRSPGPPGSSKSTCRCQTTAAAGTETPIFSSPPRPGWRDPGRLRPGTAAATSSILEAAGHPGPRGRSGGDRLRPSAADRQGYLRSAYLRQRRRRRIGPHPARIVHESGLDTG